MSRHARMARQDTQHYPRIVRVNEILREVVADEIERVGGSDHRLGLVTVTGVRCEPDLRHAVVFLASLPGPVHAALQRARPRLQAAVAAQVRLRRTPQLSFAADPAVAQGERVDQIIRALHGTAGEAGAGGGAPGEA